MLPCGGAQMAPAQTQQQRRCSSGGGVAHRSNDAAAALAPLVRARRTVQAPRALPVAAAVPLAGQRRGGALHRQLHQQRLVACSNAGGMAAGMPAPEGGGSGNSGSGGAGGEGDAEAISGSSSGGGGEAGDAAGGARAPGAPRLPPFLARIRAPQQGKGGSDAMATVDLLEAVAGSSAALAYLDRFRAPRWLFRTVACLVLGGQVMARLFRGKVHLRNTRDQLQLVGPKSLGVALLTAGFVGMVFTIQFVREFAKLGLTRSVGGVLALALARELTPVVTSIILAGRVGSAFAAELGTMQVSEQVDSLRVLATDPVDYLVTPRVLASMLAGPILNVLCFCMGMGASVLLADLVYSVPANVILDSARRALTGYDVVTSMIKAWAFSTAISVISCAWGFTTSGGAKGVGESTTSAVVISLVAIFVLDFGLSFAFFQGQGDALKQLK